MKATSATATTAKRICYDYYYGYVYAPTGTYTDNTYYDYDSSANETGYNGRYYIWSTSSGYSSSYNGDVYVYYYRDEDGASTGYTPYNYNLGYTSGSFYLGSEYDYIYDNSQYYGFGYDEYEAW